MREPIAILGMPGCEPETLPASVLLRIAEAETLVYTPMHAACARAHASFGARHLSWNGTPSELRRLLEDNPSGSATILASGDPLFFGIASSLAARGLLPSQLELIPWFNCLQLLCHRSRLPYEKLRAVSVHGRGWEGLDAALIERTELIGVLTDSAHGPHEICERLVRYGFGSYQVLCGEGLGSASERVTTFLASEVPEVDFLQPNCLILRRTAELPRPFGLEESQLQGLPGRPNMVTKAQCRLRILAAMRIREGSCLWDLGFCTGSVSLEARLLNPGLRVLAFEQRPECEDLLERNMRCFGVPGIEALMGDYFQRRLETLPAPDRVFIGGHGGRLMELLRRLEGVLAEGALVGFVAVKEENAVMFASWAREAGRQLVFDQISQAGEPRPVRMLVARRNHP